MKVSILILIVLTSLFAISCSNNENVITITEAGSFTLEECQDHGFGNSVIMIESAYCGHCRETRGDFQAACDELNVSCEFWDLAEAEGLKQLEDRDIMVQFTPTMIYGCTYTVGAETKDEYVTRIQTFLQGEN